MRRAFTFGTGRDWSSWPVLLLLLTVLVPSGGVVWMMRAAMENDRLAGRQRLAEAYRVQLETAKQNICQQWEERRHDLEAEVDGESPAETFARWVGSGVVDSVLVLDAAGAIAYPDSVALAVESYHDSPWRRAERLEYGDGDWTAAASAYEAIAVEESAAPSRAARAKQAQARCLLRAGSQDEAVRVLTALSRQDASDFSGRSIAADAELRLLELLDVESSDRSDILENLRIRLREYKSSSLPAEQRRFLMRRWQELAPREAGFPTLAGHDLAAAFLDADSERPLASRAIQGGLHPTTLAGVSAEAMPSGRLIALYRADAIASYLQETASEQLAPQGVVFEIRSPGSAFESRADWLVTSLAPALPGWQLEMGTVEEPLYDAAANERRALLVWVAGSLLAVTLAMAWLVASGVRRQMQVARLKNDLVATVSHELKTPLASIRLLVDTLLAAEPAERASGADVHRREYLELIAGENARLGGLIDNFLTFSRMDRGKHRFECQSVDVQEVIKRAAAAVEDRFDGVERQLIVSPVSEASDLKVRGDFDALVMATINLLDNAWKYSGEKKLVRVSARRVGDEVAIDVEDNGIGLAPGAARRVFDGFYQVDQRVSRSQGGCGLGLSIVRTIVEAHGGRARVESRPAGGCKFVLTLPAEVL